MNQQLSMQGKSISMATQLSTLTFVNTPNLKSTHIEFSIVATSGATGLMLESDKMQVVNHDGTTYFIFARKLRFFQSPIIMENHMRIQMNNHKHNSKIVFRSTWTYNTIEGKF